MSEMNSAALATTGSPMTAGAYCWQPRPVNVWVGMEPLNRLEEHVLNQLQTHLQEHGCQFVSSPEQTTALAPVPHLAIGFGRDLDEEVDPRRVYGRLPKPRGIVLMITATERLPDMKPFALARGQLLKKAAHIGLTVEGDVHGTTVSRVLWAAMAGNHRLMQGDEEGLFDNLALRVQAHAGAEKVTRHDGDDESRLSWAQWCASPVHRDIAAAAHALGDAGMIEDRVHLELLGSSRQAATVLRFLERSALGEGMRSQLDPGLRVMGVTASGGGKINVSPDPLAGHVVPIGQLTRNGYVRALPAGCPVTYNAPSVETHENGLVYLAGALLEAGRVQDLASFLRFLDAHFAQHERVDIVPAGLTPKILAIDHFHRHPDPTSVDPAQVEIVYPDKTAFPEIDFPCGVREAELHLLSAIFQARSLQQPGRLSKVVLAVLPGHGSCAVYGGPRHKLTEILTRGIKFSAVAGV